MAPRICAPLDYKLHQNLNPQHRNSGITSWYAPALEINTSLSWLGCRFDDREIVVRFPVLASDFLLSRHPDRLWSPSSHLFRALLLWVKRPACDVTTHFHLVTTLQTHGPIPPLSTPSCWAERLYLHLAKYILMFINAPPCWIVCQTLEKQNSYLYSLSLRSHFSLFSPATIVKKGTTSFKRSGETSVWFKLPLDFHKLCCRYSLNYTASYWPTLPTFSKSVISFRSYLQSINRSTDSTHRSVTDITICPIIRLRARIIQFTEHQLHGIRKCRANGKRKQRPAEYGYHVSLRPYSGDWILSLGFVLPICLKFSK
jgi:hypothetical protein